MHIASNVEGTILPNKDALDVFCATFPAGTAPPKYERCRSLMMKPMRSIWRFSRLSRHGNMDTAIAIRTAVMRRGKIHIQAGAGVVTDSVAGGVGGNQQKSLSWLKR